ncbi:TPA: GNAT family N-acetyltransferase [Bacillus cereus]|nr:GNAT family N-acetyltransferase [Bacillus cereus]MRD06664.1 GNAT family N-acetyltransferase [Bacillus thuringiensis]QKH04481.1 GNAT family N-acetyltransferase [Bacillus cereus]TBX56703.1 GNAT family N-acetyltransferase [Bacillus cereus]HDR8025448.1 GNAT family N-acetyltransferase [Bacillus cereus]
MLSYSIYDKGIKIEVATDYNHRRKGLATIVNAANTRSAKLGYVFDKAYHTYFVDNR